MWVISYSLDLTRRYRDREPPEERIISSSWPKGCMFYAADRATISECEKQYKMAFPYLFAKPWVKMMTSWAFTEKTGFRLRILIFEFIILNS